MEEKFAEIIDKGECMSTLYTYPQIPWPEAFLKNLACREHWAKDNFYPSNGLVGKVAYTIEKNMELKIDIPIYILKIKDKFFVPMSPKGIKFISESDYRLKDEKIAIKGMDKEQKELNLFTRFFSRKSKPNVVNKNQEKGDLNIDESPELTKWHKMPTITPAISRDIIGSVRVMSNDYDQITISQLLEFLVYYAVDLLIEYHDKALGILPRCIIDDISEQVLHAAQINFPEFYDEEVTKRYFELIEVKIRQKGIKSSANNYLIKFRR